MIKRQKILTIEYTAIILLWSIVIISPLLFMDDFTKNWRGVYIMWTECSIVGFVFLVNRFILMPHLFFAKRYAKYIIALTILFALLWLFIFVFDGVAKIMYLLGESTTPPPIHPNIGGAPHPTMPPHSMPPAAPNTGSVIPPTITTLTLSAIVIGLDMGLSIAIKWLISEQKQAQIDKERVTTQLSNLQSQVSPHFFMNTLNNIHALVDIDSNRAKQTIIELSNLMDYLLYDSSNKERVTLQRELDFISNYINLMRLRFSKQVIISFSYSDHVPSVKIPPLLFLNFIENSFKYGVDYERESFVKVRFDFSDTTIEMTTINSNHSDSVTSSRHGLGISNSIKRLDLLYEDRYTLEINDIDKIYYVNLKVPIQ